MHIKTELFGEEEGDMQLKDARHFGYFRGFFGTLLPHWTQGTGKSLA